MPQNGRTHAKTVTWDNSFAIPEYGAPKCTDEIVNVNLSEIKDLNKVKITLNDADDIVFIFAHGAENHVGNFDLENLTNLFENSAGKTFVFISCKSGVKVNNIMR